MSARTIVLASERYNKSEPVNIGAGFEKSIRELVELMVKFTGFEGEILWDATKPDGQPRRMLDVSRAEREFGFRAKTLFEEGLRKTIEWYREMPRFKTKRRPKVIFIYISYKKVIREPSQIMSL